MLCRKLRQIIYTKSNDKHVAHRSLICPRFYSRRYIDILFSARVENMSSTLRLRHLLRDLVVTRLFSAWTRSYLISSVVRRCRKDGRMREVLQCFRQSLLRPRRTLLFTVTAAYKNNEEASGPPPPCRKNITDEELLALLEDLESVEELSRATLYCAGCARRVIIDNAQPNVRYCKCKDMPPPEQSYDGWEPYMEAEDIIIWRKEYKPGGLYAYKVYGRYKHIQAKDFAAIQVDGGYRQVWDSAVAALSVVERNANGLPDQTVLHWEVLWPRLFANRDYVYLRRHKEFDTQTRCLSHKDGMFTDNDPCAPIVLKERENVHSNAKRKGMAHDRKVSLVEADAAKSKTAVTLVLDGVHNRNCEEHREAKLAKAEIEEAKKAEPKQDSKDGVKTETMKAEAKTEAESKPETAKVDTQAEAKIEVAKSEAAKDTARAETAVIEAAKAADADKAKAETAKAETAKAEVSKAGKAENKPKLSNEKVYVIVSRSCVHPKVPETRSAIRVTEYWSHMVIKTINGPDKPGMEFVLTYYDEPAVGGLPTAVTSWAMGRAGPAFLERMRRAATEYQGWRARNSHKPPDFTPFGPEKVSFERGTNTPLIDLNELEMESSRQGPDLEQSDYVCDQGTQTDMVPPTGAGDKPDHSDQVTQNTPTHEGDSKQNTIEVKRDPLELNVKLEEVNYEKENAQEEKEEETRRWWRYLYPSYYFI